MIFNIFQYICPGPDGPAGSDGATGGDLVDVHGESMVGSVDTWITYGLYIDNVWIISG
jgi:hypothetical protein